MLHIKKPETVVISTDCIYKCQANFAKYTYTAQPT